MNVACAPPSSSAASAAAPLRGGIGRSSSRAGRGTGIANVPVRWVSAAHGAGGRALLPANRALNSFDPNDITIEGRAWSISLAKATEEPSSLDCTAHMNWRRADETRQVDVPHPPILRRLIGGTSYGYSYTALGGTAKGVAAQNTELDRLTHGSQPSFAQQNEKAKLTWRAWSGKSYPRA
jgi:hypothetical protein